MVEGADTVDWPRDLDLLVWQDILVKRISSVQAVYSERESKLVRGSEAVYFGDHQDAERRKTRSCCFLNGQTDNVGH